MQKMNNTGVENVFKCLIKLHLKVTQEQKCAATKICYPVHITSFHFVSSGITTHYMSWGYFEWKQHAEWVYIQTIWNMGWKIIILYIT